MNLRLFLAIVRTRALLVLFTLLVTVATGAVLTSLQPRRYEASAFLVVNFDSQNPVQSTGVPAQLSVSYLATQLDIIRSRKVAIKAVELLQLESNPDARAAYAESGSDTIPFRDWLAEDLMAGLTVEPMPDSRVVSVRYEAFDPNQAARVANAFADAFIATTLELMTEPAKQNAAWFDEQIKTLRKRLEEAQARLTTFQRQKGIVALDEKLGTETARLNDLSKSLVEAQQELYDVRSRQLGENHPEYRRAASRERALMASLENQKKNILQIRGQRDELEALARELEVEQQTYAATLQSYYKTVMESQVNQTNVSVLTPAIAPLEPTSPNVVLNMASATALGLILGVALAVAVEVLNRRVRSARDIAEVIETKVLGTV